MANSNVDERGNGSADEVKLCADTDDQWSVYESNVQAYRGHMLSAQSLFLAVGAILLGTGYLLPLLAVFAMAMAVTWWLGYPVILARCRIVDYHKFGLATRFNADGLPFTAADNPLPLEERMYARVGHSKARENVHRVATLDGEAFTTLRVTRRKLDVVLPALLSAVWVIFVISALLPR